MKKEIVGIFVFMLLVGTVLPVTGNVLVNKNHLSMVNGNTLYVGGDGPGNYTSIQDAVNDSVDGDTVFVYDDSSPYFGNLIVDKSINLIGENMDTTIIDGQKSLDTHIVYITANNVLIQGFTITGGRSPFSSIFILSDNSIIKGNILSNSSNGIKLGNTIEASSNYNIIINNFIKENDFSGVLLDGYSSNNIISNNIISFNDAHGIFLRIGDCHSNIIKHNKIFSNAKIGVFLIFDDNFNMIQHNSIFNNLIGIQIALSHDNNILENNIYNNRFNAQIFGDIWDLIKGNPINDNIFDRNYWGRFRLLPKPIFGFYTHRYPYPLIPLVIFDKNPVSKPYDIGI